MNQRISLGPVSRMPIGVVRDHGSRLECIALHRWLLLGTLEHISCYWSGDFGPHATPESSVLGWFR